MNRVISFMVCIFLAVESLNGQDILPVVRGYVTDIETEAPLPASNVMLLNSSPPVGAITDSSGKFVLKVPTGRISLKISFLGYEDLYIRDILVTTGRDVSLNAGLREKLIRTSEVVVRPGPSGITSISRMAAVSNTTIRTDDALRYAGGFYDPSRIVNAFAGVSASNSDDSNDLIIRGNSPRGLLWRLEGIEIPNPNHFSSGMGGSGGAFSSITSNVVDNFDFFTGAFPAEYGNAFSGVMDLNLRRGNPDDREFAFQTGMIGAEIAAEGPIVKGTGSSFLINVRYTNFKILSDLDLIDLGSTNYAPRTKDLVFNFFIPLKKYGTLSFFGIAGSSALGKTAVMDTAKWLTNDDRWEEMEEQSSFTTGARHFLTFQGGKSSLRSVIAFSSFSDMYHEGLVDSSLILQKSYYFNFQYPSLRSSLLFIHKFNSRSSVRTGIDYSLISANMENLRQNKSGLFDTLVAPYSTTSLVQSHIQLKSRISDNLEVSAGLHWLYFALNNESSLEPRLGLRWQMWPRIAFISGAGLHSRTESLAAYNTFIKDQDGIMRTLNQDLGLCKSSHTVAGFEIIPFTDLRIRIEWYRQKHFNVPIVNQTSSRYSTLNTAERLPEALLENAGTGKNEGLEITVEKSFSRNFYFLITGSLFDSKYRAGDGRNYNTLYNTNYNANMLAGKDFRFGKQKRNTIGINAKVISRGGYRYTPVNDLRTIKQKQIVYLNTLTNTEQLPDFLRVDAGISYRRNHSRFSWIVMLDVQNATSRHNVFRRRFYFDNGKIVSRDVVSLGMVPVFNFRIEF